MRLLHTSDWHLGRRLHGEELLADQGALLEWLLALAQAERHFGSLEGRHVVIIGSGSMSSLAASVAAAASLLRRGAAAARPAAAGCDERLVDHDARDVDRPHAERTGTTSSRGAARVRLSPGAATTATTATHGQRSESSAPPGSTRAGLARASVRAGRSDGRPTAVMEDSLSPVTADTARASGTATTGSAVTIR